MGVQQDSSLSVDTSTTTVVAGGGSGQRVVKWFQKNNLISRQVDGVSQTRNQEPMGHPPSVANNEEVNSQAGLFQLSRAIQQAGQDAVPTPFQTSNSLSQQGSESSAVATNSTTATQTNATTMNPVPAAGYPTHPIIANSQQDKSSLPSTTPNQTNGQNSTKAPAATSGDANSMVAEDRHSITATDTNQSGDDSPSPANSEGSSSDSSQMTDNQEDSTTATDTNQSDVDSPSPTNKKRSFSSVSSLSTDSQEEGKCDEHYHHMPAKLKMIEQSSYFTKRYLDSHENAVRECENCKVKFGSEWKVSFRNPIWCCENANLATHPCLHAYCNNCYKILIMAGPEGPDDKVRKTLRGNPKNGYNHRIAPV